MKFPNDFYRYLQTHTLIGIKGGIERDTFLKIWMVEVDSRVFARSWNKSERSWFTALIETGKGEIKYGEKVISISGKKLPSDHPIHPRINQAYLDRYNQPHNIQYTLGITKPEYVDFTMELFHVV